VVSISQSDKPHPHPLPPRFHPISPKVTQSTQESAEGRNPISYASIASIQFFKELALARHKGAHFFVSHFIRLCQAKRFAGSGAI
jgi:hypothetical protein